MWPYLAALLLLLDGAVTVYLAHRPPAAINRAWALGRFFDRIKQQPAYPDRLATVRRHGSTPGSVRFVDLLGYDRIGAPAGMREQFDVRVIRADDAPLLEGALA